MVSDWLNTSKVIDKSAKKPCHRLGLCPYGKIIEEFPIEDQNSEFMCKVFHHNCPIFYHVENTSEKYSREYYEKEIEELFNKGGLKVGSDHSDDDNRLKLEYAIKKILEEHPDQESILTKLHQIVEKVSLDEIYSWNSQR
ncbi:MAG: hypothetical protein ACTSPN_05610 [Promethearchaeota archaeon]